MSKLITGTHHIALKCKSFEQYQEAVRFYHEILQMEIVRSWGEKNSSGIMLDTGNSLMEIFAEGCNCEEGGTVNHFALATEEVDTCIELVRKAGYKITKEPDDIVIPSRPGFPARIAFCIGPVGEEIEFFCER